MGKIKLLHGSDHIIEKPDLLLGKTNNDYGRGFYCTQELSMAMEWACKKNSDGFVNKYVLEQDSLNILNLLDGIVTETGRTYAKVCSIINDSSSVSAKSSQAGDTCVVQGDSESVQKDGTIDVTYISKDADMKEGEELITSHISSKYLEGIKIGTVSKISTDSSNLTKSAKVTPFVDFQHIEDVLVITQLKEVPADSDSAD